MNEYFPWIIIAVLIIVFVFLKRRNTLNAPEARSLLEKGAILVDVRSPEEYANGKLSKAINIPLPDLANRIAAEVPDKNTIILCHCASGIRSGVAASKLRKFGYPNSHNIGSFHQAAKIVEGSGK